MTTKCNCGRRTPFAHKHAETCPCFHPQSVGRFERPVGQPAGATHVWDTGVIGRHPYLKVDGDGVAVWQLQNGGFWQWIGNTLDDISGVVQPLEVRSALTVIEDAAIQFVIDAAKNMLATDELGKVWDVLHAAGINSGGELSASEGVKLLAEDREALNDYAQLIERMQLRALKHGEQRRKLRTENWALRAALAGMLFEFDDGVNGGTESPLPVLNHARTLVDAKQWGEG